MRTRAQRTFATFALGLTLHTTGACAVLVALGPLARAQTGKPQGPQDLVQRGRAQFDDQQYEESIQTLSAALVRPNNTKPQKLEIYRLLALNYITLNRKDEAESAVRGLLALQPDYTLPASESPRFRDFFAAVRQKWEAEGRPGLVRDTVTAAVVTMTHTSPASADKRKQIDLTAALTDPDHKVRTVKLFYRHGSTDKFEEAEGTLEGDHVRASIPPEAVLPTIVEYYLEGDDKGGLPLVTRGDAEAPLRIPVSGGPAGWVLPVAITGGAVVAIAAVVGGILLFGSKSSSTPSNMNHPPAGTTGTTTVTINLGGM